MILIDIFEYCNGIVQYILLLFFGYHKFKLGTKIVNRIPLRMERFYKIQAT